MNKPFLLIFDLDGTISDPSVGIGRSFNHALTAFGYPEISEQDVSQYIGPPLDVAFRQIVRPAGDNEILGMVAKYRERYGEIGCAENVVYPGIPEALAHLASRGIPMGVCTTKRADFAEQILALFGLREYFEFVSGGDIGVHKRDQLGALLERGFVTKDATMIGDRAVDVIAARAHGLHAVGVLWGHGSEEELLGAGPDRVLRAPRELMDLERAE
jgi:phosphoglycolate phosphatase